MVERWHLYLAAWAVVAGVVVVAAELRAPVWIRDRSVAVAGLTGALLGSLDSARSVIWVMLAVLLVMPADRQRSPHPLGAMTVTAAMVSLVGVWSAVPDTEPSLAAGCVLAVVGAERLWSRRPVGPPASAALVVAVVGAAWVGSAGSTPAIASAAAVGMVLCAPAVLGFRKLDLQRAAALAAVHVVGALTVPRLLMRQDSRTAVMGAVALLLVDLAIAAVVGRLRSASVPADGPVA